MYHINNDRVLLHITAANAGRPFKKKENDRQRSLDIERWLKKKFREGFANMKTNFEELDTAKTGMVSLIVIQIKVLVDLNLRLTSSGCSHG